ncbi:hypothetical protein ES705_22913 [subsurface metagenome]
MEIAPVMDKLLIGTLFIPPEINLTSIHPNTVIIAAVRNFFEYVDTIE